MPKINSPIRLSRKKRTFGQKAADTIAKWAGSWIFIIILSCLLCAWIIANILLVVYRWDPYPFILLNLFLSFMAAYQAPIILMSQNRAADWDRAKAAKDLAVDTKAESEIRDMQSDLEEIKKLLREMKK
ncbi:MAG: DUF1003 domain-containing protein [Candidatus Moraniibacteriota bacterium]|nr:MAG: DUF1003 domain-containing protein [Candidatus Moranbacteria bacterium]